MAYKKTTVNLGDEIIITKSYTPLHNNTGRRQPRSAPTSEKVKKHNARLRARQLYYLLKLNFKPWDLHCSLTYKQGTVQTVEEAKVKVRDFLKKYRVWCKKNIRECKYIWTTDVGKRGGVHHHLVIPKMDEAVLQQLWEHGRVVRNSYLWADGDFEGLAAYLLEKTKGGALPDPDAKGRRRYSCSKGLVRPEPKKEIIPAKRWSSNPKPPDGWLIKPGSLYESVDDFSGYPYQTYTLIRLRR